jgi:hypothetical protein
VLHDLYAGTLARLTGGRVERPNRHQLAPRLHTLVQDGLGLWDVKAHLALASDRYVGSTTVQRMAEALPVDAR